MQDTEKKSIKDKARSSAGTIPITAADLDKKPIRVRKKSKAAPEENAGDSKNKRPKVSKPESNYKQNSKLKTLLNFPGKEKTGSKLKVKTLLEHRQKMKKK